MTVTGSSPLAVNGGVPIRERLLPYGRQDVSPDDIAAVVAVLQSDWLTTGPAVERFEQAVAETVGARHAVAVSSGTAALHAAMHALGVGPGDEVIVPAITFAASANCALYQGATPVFADVDADTLLVDIDSVRTRLTPRTRAIVAVDYAGQPCAYDELRAVLPPQVRIVDDACHALGAAYRGRPLGSVGDLSCFSFHPVKHITTGEGGMVTTDDAALADRMRSFRNHGITTDHRQRERLGAFHYEMTALGFNYRISDVQCALGASQIHALPAFLARRRAIARRYDAAFAAMPAVAPLRVRADVDHAYHLYVIKLGLERLRASRAEIFRALRAEGIGVNVHYEPVYLHPYYRERLGTARGVCPVAEAAYDRLLTLPMFPAMTDRDADDVIAAVDKVVTCFGV